jgi:transposase-like protein
VARLGVGLLFQVALEAEITEFLGRDRYARGEHAHEGSRNGYSAITVKTTSGPITMGRLKLRGNAEPFASRLLGLGVTRTKALESLVIASFVRGLSVRDVEAAPLGGRRRPVGLVPAGDFDCGRPVIAVFQMHLRAGARFQNRWTKT